MGGYQRYEAYQDSGVEWLGKIPSHWEVKRLKNMASCNDEVLGENTPFDYEIEYIDISSVDLVQGITNSELISFGKAPSRARRKVRDGDIIVSTVRTYLKSIAAIRQPSENTIVSTGFAVIRPIHTCDPDYIGYVLQSEGFVHDVVANSVGVSYPAINSSVLTRLPIIEPPLEEQKSIARFLDYKTAQIDALIAKKESLLKKLAEKRSALISQAVTKGLDPQVPMKDSGVEWLGEIPAHWRFVPFRWCCRITEGQVDPKNPEFEIMPLIAPNHIESKTGRLLLRETAQEQGAISGKYLYDKGAVLYSKIRPALVKACIADEPGLCSADMYPITVSDVLMPKFLLYQLLSKGFTQFAVLASDRVAMPKVNRETLSAFPIIIPPVEDQIKVITMIDEQIGQLDASAALVKSAIARLKEYRTALITNAVTGAIDVRNVPIPNDLQEAAS